MKKQTTTYGQEKDALPPSEATDTEAQAAKMQKGHEKKAVVTLIKTISKSPDLMLRRLEFQTQLEEYSALALKLAGWTTAMSRELEEIQARGPRPDTQRLSQATGRAGDSTLAKDKAEPESLPSAEVAAYAAPAPAAPAEPNGIWTGGEKGRPILTTDLAGKVARSPALGLSPEEEMPAPTPGAVHTARPAPGTLAAQALHAGQPRALSPAAGAGEAADPPRAAAAAGHPADRPRHDIVPPPEASPAMMDMMQSMMAMIQGMQGKTDTAMQRMR